MHIKCPETQLMHKNAKWTRNNSKFKHDTHVLVACSLYVNVLAIQTPSFPLVTPFCLSKHNEKIRETHLSLLVGILFRLRLEFLCINWVSGHLMCIIQIWTTSTCSNAPKFAKNHMCVFGWIYRSHARNGNKIQTSGRRGSAGKIEKLGFLIPVISKHAWKSWNLAWSHDMAPTCCGSFFGRIGQALV